MSAMFFCRFIRQSLRLLLMVPAFMRFTFSFMIGNFIAFLFLMSFIIIIIHRIAIANYNLLLMKKEKARPKEVYMQRVKCYCMAQKHELVNNCLGCGKVVCAQEGEGNCLHCGKLVVRPDGLFIDDSDKLFPSLSKEEQKSVAIERSKAIQHKNKLVERDKSDVQSQNIFDEQVDYYEISENKWLDEGSRQRAIDRILQKEKFVEEEGRKTNIIFDPLSGQFVKQEFDFNEEEFKQQGRAFLEKREIQERQAKESLSKQKQNWDERVLRSEKMKDLCSQLLQKSVPKVPVDISTKRSPKITEIIVENE